MQEHRVESAYCPTNSTARHWPHAQRRLFRKSGAIRATRQNRAASATKLYGWPDRNDCEICFRQVMKLDASVGSWRSVMDLGNRALPGNWRLYFGWNPFATRGRSHLARYQWMSAARESSR